MNGFEKFLKCLFQSLSEWVLERVELVELFTDWLGKSRDMLPTVGHDSFEFSVYLRLKKLTSICKTDYAVCSVSIGQNPWYSSYNF